MEGFDALVPESINAPAPRAGRHEPVATLATTPSTDSLSWNSSCAYFPKQTRPESAIAAGANRSD